VIRKDQVRLVANQKSLADGDAGLLDLVNLGKQRLRIDDDAVADDTGNPGVKNPGGQQAQHELAAIRIHGVTRVVSALVARHDREMRRQQIDDFSLALVSPLRTEHGDVHTCSILLNS